MTTDEDRDFAFKQASLIYQNHVAKKQGLGNHIATEIGYEEMMRRGLLAECDFASRFNVPMDTRILDEGDGGRDFSLWLYTPRGGSRFAVNIKAKSVQVSWDGLMKSGTHLRVPVNECSPTTIYVFAVYHEQTDDAEVLRWQWGRVLMERNERAVFTNSNGAENYIMLFQDLRELEELEDRMRPPSGFVGYDGDGHFVHYCHCGKWADGVGYDVDLRANKFGRWFCADHKPEAERG